MTFPRFPSSVGTQQPASLSEAAHVTVSRAETPRVQKIERITPERKTSAVKADLASFCALAKALGANDARIATAKDLARSLRADSGHRDATSPQARERRSIHWPEPVYPRDRIDEAIRLYQWGVAFKVEVRTPVSAQGSDVVAAAGPDPSSVRQAHEEIFRIGASIESECFYRGYHLAMAFASADCRDIFCRDELRCWASIKGRPCLHPYKARPSVEACGITPALLAEILGWAPGSESIGSPRGGEQWFLGLVLVT